MAVMASGGGSDDSPPPVGVVRRNWTNFISGIVLQFVICALWVLNDPLAVVPWVRELPSAERLPAVESAIAAAGLVAVSVGGWLAFVVPKVELGPEGVVVHNPLTTWRLPAGALAASSRWFAWPRVPLGDEARAGIVVWALEHSLLDDLRGRQHAIVQAPLAVSGEAMRSRRLTPGTRRLGIVWAVVLVAEICLKVVFA